MTRPSWREICKMLDDVDDMLESFIGKDIMEEPLEQYDKLLSPAVHFDFKNITFSFLPHQVKDMDALVKNLESSAPEIIGVAPYEQCKQFIEALARYQKFSDIRNVGAAIHSMIESVTEKMDEVGFKDDEEWTYLTKIFGSNAIPAESAATITKAIKKAEKDGAITSKNRWQLIRNACHRISGRKVSDVICRPSASTIPNTTTIGLGRWQSREPRTTRLPRLSASRRAPLFAGSRSMRA